MVVLRESERKWYKHDKYLKIQIPTHYILWSTKFYKPSSIIQIIYKLQTVLEYLNNLQIHNFKTKSSGN